MDPYRGIVKIECDLKKCAYKTAGSDVRPPCLGCDKARVSILDLEGEEIFTLKAKTNPALRKLRRDKKED